MSSLAERIRKLLQATPNIKPKEASKVLKVEYSKSFSNNFYRQKKTIKNQQKITGSGKKSKKPKEPIIELDIEITDINPDTIGKLLIAALNENPTDIKTISEAKDWYKTFRMTKGEKIEEYDMTKFYKIGKEMRKTGHKITSSTTVQGTAD